jgi:surface polysaccharide O-acyltransferase-like enzyme
MEVKKKINIGFAALRIYLSFLVVTAHCFQPNSTTSKKNIIRIIHNSIHVPTFFLMSFYFCYNSFKSKNIRKNKIRLQRLLIPYFVWPIIIWSINNLLSFFFIKISIISFKSFILQFITGNDFMRILWFQCNLILITLLIMIIHFLLSEKLVLYALINLLFFGMFFTYSEYNYILFSKYNFCIMFSFGRFFEVCGFCVTGYFLASSNFVNILSKNRSISISIFMPILILIIKYKIFLEISGFYYQGLRLYFLSISVFFIFSLIPNEGIENKYIIKFIKHISIHTVGIYFIHFHVFYYLHIFSLVKSMTLNASIIVFIISYFISLFGKLIFRKTILINLFQ